MDKNAEKSRAAAIAEEIVHNLPQRHIQPFVESLRAILELIPDANALERMSNELRSMHSQAFSDSIIVAAAEKAAAHLEEHADGTFRSTDKAPIRLLKHHIAATKRNFDISQGLLDVKAERNKQLEKWGPEHDTRHIANELIWAAVYYACPNREQAQDAFMYTGWGWQHGKRDERSPRERIIIATALLLAELDRLDALEQKNA